MTLACLFLPCRAGASTTASIVAEPRDDPPLRVGMLEAGREQALAKALPQTSRELPGREAAERLAMQVGPDEVMIGVGHSDNIRRITRGLKVASNDTAALKDVEDGGRPRRMPKNGPQREDGLDRIREGPLRRHEQASSPLEDDLVIVRPAAPQKLRRSSACVGLMVIVMAVTTATVIARTVRGAAEALQKVSGMDITDELV